MSIDIVRSPSSVKACPDEGGTEAWTGLDLLVDAPSPHTNTTDEWQPHRDSHFVGGLRSTLERRLKEGDVSPFSPEQVERYVGLLAVPEPDFVNVQNAERAVSAMVSCRPKAVDVWAEYENPEDVANVALRLECEAAARPATQKEINQRQAHHRQQAKFTRRRAFLRGDLAAVLFLTRYIRSASENA